MTEENPATPPATPPTPPATPPSPPNDKPPVGAQNNDQMLTAIRALPEQLANAVAELIPKGDSTPPATPPTTPPTTPPATTPPTSTSDSDKGGKRGLGAWFFGIK